MICGVVCGYSVQYLSDFVRVHKQAYTSMLPWTAIFSNQFQQKPNKRQMKNKKEPTLECQTDLPQAQYWCRQIAVGVKRAHTPPPYLMSN